MDLGISGKVAFVTGGNRGIGKAIVESLLNEGCNVAFTARKATQSLGGFLTQYSDKNLLALNGDMTNVSDITRCIKRTREEFGYIDIIVNNVGGGPYVSYKDPDEEWQMTFALNFASTVRICRLTVPDMQKRRWGRVVNISSIWGRETGGAQSYNAAKSAVVAFTRTLAHEVARDNVTVNCVCPGSIMFKDGAWDTNANTQSEKRGITREEWISEFVTQNIPGARFGTPEEVANIVTFLASEKARWMIGSIVMVDGGQSHTGI